MEASWVRFAAIVTARHCKRAFLDKPVPRDVLARVLATAAHAPSTRNGQPWGVAVVTGTARDELARRLCAEFDRDTPQRPDYANRPASIDADVERRWRTAGAGLLRALDIARDDADGRRAHVRANLEFHGAPAVLVCHLPADAAPGTFLEMGLFLQNTMLGLVACGLGSCPQFSVAGYPEVLRAQLGLPGRLMVCALAVGYPDPRAPVNGYAPDRLAVHEYVSWHDQATPWG